ncbi:MAG: hypothetical protein GX854_08495 [Clostridiales bacterium]|nr:hypothetical protein [Clostridiales bacterium]
MNKNSKYILCLSMITIMLLTSCNMLGSEPSKDKEEGFNKKKPPKALTQMERELDEIIKNLESVRDERARLLREQEHPSKTSQSEAQQQVQTQNKEQQNDNKNTQHSDPKPDWNSLEKTIETLHEHWNSFEPSARMDGAMNETIKEFGKQLINLTEQIIARNEKKTMVAATNLYSSLPDFLKLYDHNQPPEIKEVIGLVRLIIIYGQQEKWEETKPLLKQIKEAWQEAKTKMKKPDEMLNKRIESAINDFQLVVAEKKNDIAKIKGNIIIKSLDQLE